MKEIRPKEDKAVSPIIATILLIAITVVLAATLVTILGGFTHSASNTFGDAAATVSETPTATSYSNVTTLSITSFSGGNVSGSQITMTITLNTGSSYSVTLPTSSSSSSDKSVTIVSGVETLKIAASSGYFTAGSVYTITDAGTSASHSYVTGIELTHDSATIYQSGTISVT